jgi:hypothetical protein
MNAKDDEARINELIVELSECREDERNTQNQILQVISVAGAVIGFLLGASYLGKAPNEGIIVFNIKEGDIGYMAKFGKLFNQYTTNARIMFLLSLLVFCTAFAYVIILGITNTLRYYYIQKIEDRIHALISDTSDDRKEGSLLHWSSYIGPIITRNIHHIKSSHTALVHFCYTTAACGVTLFSVLMVVSLFFNITPKTNFDYIVISIFILVSFLTILLFIRTSSRTKEVVQFAWNMARDNQAKRAAGMGSYQYETSTSFKRMLSYLFYPKKQDLQKPLLICLGFIYGSLLMSGIPALTCLGDLLNGLPAPMYCLKLVFAWFVFDFLAYQARYQINDIRGLEEDKEAGKTNRLPWDACRTPEDAVKLSSIVALMKIVASITITIIWGDEMRFVLLIGLAFLLFSTICYESVRAKGQPRLIFFWVGAGYPLRFFLGFFLLVPLKSISFSTAMIFPALWAYGTFSSILSWVSEVIQRISAAETAENTKTDEKEKHFPPSYRKKHFPYLQSLIMERYQTAKEHPVNGKVLPLREEGNRHDPWNMAMITCMISLFLAACCEKHSVDGIMIEVTICFSFLMSFGMQYKIKLIPICIGWACIFTKIALFLFVYPFSMRCLLLSVLQMIVTVTYFVLCYQPQLKKCDYKKRHIALKDKLIKTVLGEFAFDVLHPQNKNK